ncbi:MAG: thiamine ABC transporter substrate binding subunit [Anaerolineales bacterium]|jgi:thiamine transport system substrate-binding protein
MKRFLVLLLLPVVACAPRLQGPEPLTVMTHDSFAVTNTVIHDFEQANDASVTFLKSGDAGAALNKAILTKSAPLADVFYGVDNTFLARALSAGIYEAYDAPALGQIPADFQLDPTHRALPVDYGDVCINYDKAYFTENKLPVPRDLEELTNAEYKGLLVMENPATSSPGLAFLLATVKHFGDPGYLDYWRSLRANGLVVVDGWETAYYTNFSGSSGHGPQPMVVSYASSPPAEVMFATAPLKDAPTASIIGPDTCFRQIEFVGILNGTTHLNLARKFIDFMLGTEFQAGMPDQMFVYPVLPGVPLPDAFVKYAQVPAQPATLPPQEIADKRDTWIQAWTDAVLH